jgi:hypothetical protein
MLQRGEPPFGFGSSSWGKPPRPDCLTATQWLINLSEGTNKNELWGLGAVEPQVAQTSGGIPTIRVGQTVIGLRCSEYTHSRREND